MTELIFKIIGYIFLTCVVLIALWQLVLLIIAFFTSGIWLWLLAIGGGLTVLGLIFDYFSK